MVNQAVRSKIALLHSDGTLDEWMENGSIEGGSVNAVAIQSDGRILIGGSFTNVNRAKRWGIARLRPGGQPPRIVQPKLLGTAFSVSVLTAPNKSYTLQSKTSLAATTWTSVATIPGDGTVQSLTDPQGKDSGKFYRVLEE